MANILSCNLGSYRKFQDQALPHLQSIGVKHVEVRAPALSEARKVRIAITAIRARPATLSTGTSGCHSLRTSNA